SAAPIPEAEPVTAMTRTRTLLYLRGGARATDSRAGERCGGWDTRRAAPHLQDAASVATPPSGPAWSPTAWRRTSRGTGPRRRPPRPAGPADRRGGEGARASPSPRAPRRGRPPPSPAPRRGRRAAPAPQPAASGRIRGRGAAPLPRTRSLLRGAARRPPRRTP